VALAIAVTVTASASAPAQQPPSQPSSPPPQPPPPSSSGTVHSDQLWPIKTREHVDLWLHGFALVQDDSARVPLFRRSYRDDMTVMKNKANVFTKLDANHDQLHARFAANRNLTNAQFLAIETGSWEELKQTVSAFLKANGDPNHAKNRQMAGMVARMAAYFPTASDRDWLQLFVASLDDEREHYYHAYWVEQQLARRPVLATVDSLWQRVERPRLQRFLNDTEQPTGDLLLSLPLGAEGRTEQASKHNNIVAVEFPDSSGRAIEAIYVFAHEAVGIVAAAAINDNITPAQRRAGLGAQYSSAAAVRGGLMLLERTAPDLADGYCRFYLDEANVPIRAASVTGATGSGVSPTVSPKSALEAAFPLPDIFRDGIAKQLDVVIGGI